MKGADWWIEVRTGTRLLRVRVTQEATLYDGQPLPPGWGYLLGPFGSRTVAIAVAARHAAALGVAVSS